MSVSSEFQNTHKFPQNFRSLFPQIIPNVRKNCTPYFHRIVRPKICLKFALKNFKYTILQIISLSSTPSPTITLQFFLPYHPICHNDKSTACEGRTRWLEANMDSFQIQHATNDITCLTRYSSNIAIYANVHVLVISLY